MNIECELQQLQDFRSDISKLQELLLQLSDLLLEMQNEKIDGMYKNY